MWNPFIKRPAGTKPAGYAAITYSPATRPEQDKWSYPWPVPLIQRSGFVNTWQGNQMPGYTNFIPGVWQSYSNRFTPRSIQLTKNVALSTGANGTVSTMSQTAGNSLLGSATNTWRGHGGFWQGDELRG